MSANTARISVIMKSRVVYVPTFARAHDRDLSRSRRSLLVEHVLL